MELWNERDGKIHRQGGQHRLPNCYRQLLRAEVAQTMTATEDLDEQLRGDFLTTRHPSRVEFEALMKTEVAEGPSARMATTGFPRIPAGPRFASFAQTKN
jgi:hypothetical protein